MQFIFINGRPVQERAIGFHMNEIYRLILSPGVYPFFCVFITMPADQLDVNVHPAKREVKIKDEFRLLGILRQFTEHLLMTKSKARQAESSIFQKPGNLAERSSGKQSPEFGYGEKPPLQSGMSISDNILLFKTEDIFVQKKSDLKEKLKAGRYLGNLLKKYLVFESENSMLLIDQHAAQERITFEKLKDQIEKSDIEVAQLLAPVLIKLSPQELVVWEENKEIMEKAGFSTTLFDRDTLALHSHPQLIDQPENSVHNLLSGENIPKLDSETLARMACRSSVMAGFAMNKEQAEFQRQALLKCFDPFICPHGRPTVIEILEETLQKQFLRT
jgi:DNA mismatch repair protein MutL